MFIYLVLITFETIIGILSSIEKASFVIHMFILNDVLSIINILSNQLQKKTETLGNAANLINGVITTFEKNRSCEYFSILWQQIEVFSNDNDISLNVPSKGWYKISNSYHQENNLSCIYNIKNYYLLILFCCLIFINYMY